MWCLAALLTGGVDELFLLETGRTRWRRRRRCFLIFWRLGGLTLVFLLLLQPSREEEIIPPKVNRVTT